MGGACPPSSSLSRSIRIVWPSLARPKQPTIKFAGYGHGWLEELNGSVRNVGAHKARLDALSYWPHFDSCFLQDLTAHGILN